MAPSTRGAARPFSKRKAGKATPTLMPGSPVQGSKRPTKPDSVCQSATHLAAHRDARVSQGLLSQSRLSAPGKVAGESCARRGPRQATHLVSWRDELSKIVGGGRIRVLRGRAQRDNASQQQAPRHLPCPGGTSTTVDDRRASPPCRLRPAPRQGCQTGRTAEPVGGSVNYMTRASLQACRGCAPPRLRCECARAAQPQAARAEGG